MPIPVHMHMITPELRSRVEQARKALTVSGAAPKPQRRIRLVRRLPNYQETSGVPVDPGALSAGEAGKAAAAGMLQSTFSDLSENTEKIANGLRAAQRFAGLAHIRETLKGAQETPVDRPEQMPDHVAAAIRGNRTWIDQSPDLDEPTKAVLRGDLARESTHAMYQATNAVTREKTAQAVAAVEVGYFQMAETSGLQEADRWADSLVQEGVFSAEQGESLKLQGARSKAQKDRRAWEQNVKVNPHAVEIPAGISEVDQPWYKNRRDAALQNHEAASVSLLADRVLDGHFTAQEHLQEVIAELPFELSFEETQRINHLQADPSAAPVSYQDVVDISRALDSFDPVHDRSNSEYHRLIRSISLQPPKIRESLKARLMENAGVDDAGDTSTMQTRFLLKEGGKLISSTFHKWQSLQPPADGTPEAEDLAATEWQIRDEFQRWLSLNSSADLNEVDEFLRLRLQSALTSQSRQDPGNEDPSVSSALDSFIRADSGLSQAVDRYLHFQHQLDATETAAADAIDETQRARSQGQQRQRQQANSELEEMVQVFEDTLIDAGEDGKKMLEVLGDHETWIRRKNLNHSHLSKSERADWFRMEALRALENARNPLPPEEGPMLRSPDGTHAVRRDHRSLQTQPTHAIPETGILAPEPVSLDWEWISNRPEFSDPLTPGALSAEDKSLLLETWGLMKTLETRHRLPEGEELEEELNRIDAAWIDRRSQLDADAERWEAFRLKGEPGVRDQLNAAAKRSQAGSATTAGSIFTTAENILYEGLVRMQHRARELPQTWRGNHYTPTPVPSRPEESLARDLMDQADAARQSIDPRLREREHAAMKVMDSVIEALPGMGLQIFGGWAMKSKYLFPFAISFSQESASTYHAALRELQEQGLSLEDAESQAMEAWLVHGTVAGALDALPITRFLNDADQKTGGALKDFLSRSMAGKGKAVLRSQALLEGLTEGVQTGVGQQIADAYFGGPSLSESERSAQERAWREEQALAVATGSTMGGVMDVIARLAGVRAPPPPCAVGCRGAH